MFLYKWQKDISLKLELDYTVLSRIYLLCVCVCVCVCVFGGMPSPDFVSCG